MKKQLNAALVAVLVLLSGFSGGEGSPKEALLKIDASDEKGIVSPKIMGFNIVYAYEGDAGWQRGKGKVPKMIKALGTSQLRYPGGTVLTFYHWEKPTGQGWKDIWAPDFDHSKNTDPSVYMDIDEYLDVIREQKIEPLLGINMGSGMRHNRLQESVDEALRLMKHCLSRGVKVKYYYLDNEPYQHDANFTYTPEQYAEAVNTFVPAMKKVDPDIKIIVNTHPNTANYTQVLLEKAGKNIDLVDVHMYWKFKTATYENWKKEGLMKHRGIRPYREQREIFEKLFADAGYPDIKLVVLEWNIGPPGDGNPEPTEAQGALMVSEQFTQYIQSGLHMSTFWPLSWPGKGFRSLMDQNRQYDPQKMYDMFAMYTDVLGQQRIGSDSGVENLINLAVKSSDGKTMWVYLINKEQGSEAIAVDMELKGFDARRISAIGFDAEDNTQGPLKTREVSVKKTGSGLHQLVIPKNSFIKITLTK